jgi:hypothetical protein
MNGRRTTAAVLVATALATAFGAVGTGATANADQRPRGRTI